MKYTFNKRLIFLVTVMAVQAFAAERSPMEYRGRGRAYAGRGSGSAATAYAERALSDTDDTPELSPAYRVCILGIREGVLKSREARAIFRKAFRTELGPVNTTVPVYKGAHTGGLSLSAGYSFYPSYILDENDVAYESKLRKLKYQTLTPILEMIKPTIIEAVRRSVTYVCAENELFLHPEIEIAEDHTPKNHTRDAFIQWICDDIKELTILNLIIQDKESEYLPARDNYKQFIRLTNLLYNLIGETIENKLNDLADFGAPHPLKNITVHAKGRALKERLLAAIE